MTSQVPDCVRMLAQQVVYVVLPIYGEEMSKVQIRQNEGQNNEQTK